MDRLASLFGRTRAQLLRLVRRRPSSINELAADVGITDNAVRGHVSALERDGLLTEESRRATGGKPARIYDLTQEGEELFPKAYALVLHELIATLADTEGEEAALEKLREVGRRLGRGVSRGASLDARIRAATTVLESLGGAIEVQRNDEGVRLCSVGCPLSRVVAGSSATCRLVESLVEEIVGLPAREVCDRSGRPRCAFQLQQSETAA